MELETTYDYTDADGSLVMQVLRYRTGTGKTFRQRVPDGDGWSWSTSDLESRPLYRLPEVLAAVAAGEPIWVVEGEKDADTLAGLGYAATCNPMGADNGSGNKWRAEHTAWLAGAKVRIVADNDTSGEVHSRYVKEQLEGAGARVKLVRPPDGSKDVTEMIEAGLDQPEAQYGCPIANTYREDEIIEILRVNGFKTTDIYQSHIFPYQVEPYKSYRYLKQPWFETMPKEIFDVLEKNFGWHLLIDAEPI